MTPIAAQKDTERRSAELDARVRGAWADYREALRDLNAREYGDVEAASWDQLQATLIDVADERAELAAADAAV